MPFDTSIWIYPIDLLDGGVGPVLDEVAAIGIGGISLAATYHAGRLLLPHNPRRAVHFLEDGVAYFSVDARRYRDLSLVPKTAEAVKQIDLFGQVRDATSARGLSVSAWTICTHNSRLGREHPECTIQNVFGDRYPYGLCPAHPTVRAYLSALCREIAETCGPAALELESLGFMGYAHRSHHDKIAFRLDKGHEFLLSLCSCEHCRAAYERNHVDAERLTRTAREALERYFQSGGAPRIEANDAIDELLGKLLGSESVKGLLRARQGVVSDLLSEVRAAVPSHVPLRMMAAPSPYTTGASAGGDLSAIAPHLDAIIVDLFTSSLDEMLTRLRAARASAGATTPLFASVRAHWPDSETGDAFVDKIARLKVEGIQGLRFYHYGLIPRANLDWIRRAMGALR